MTILDEIITTKIGFVEHLPAVDHQLKAMQRIPHSLVEQLKKEFTIIFEYKRKTPSSGFLNDISLKEQLINYTKFGAKIVSILTDNPYFGGSFNDLKEARNLYPDLIILNKDFIISEKQIDVAKLNGADIILLIAKALDSETITRLYHYAYSLKLSVIVEVHDSEDVAKILALKPDVVGINNRNLEDFSVDLNTTFNLADELKYKPFIISESGISSKEDLIKVKTISNAALIGTAFMKGNLLDAI